MKITKIKYDEKTVTVKYIRSFEEGDTEEVTFTSFDKPTDEFIDALNALVPYIIKICQLPEDYDFGMRVQSISFSYAHDILGVVITALKSLDRSNAPMVINTPHLPVEDYNEGGNAPTLPAGCETVLDILKDRAMAYMDGDRAETQLKLQ